MNKYLSYGVVALLIVLGMVWLANHDRKPNLSHSIAPKNSPMPPQTVSVIFIGNDILRSGSTTEFVTKVNKTKNIRLVTRIQNKQTEPDMLLLHELKDAFPSSNIEPLFIKSSATLEEVKQSVSNLQHACADCLVIVNTGLSQVDDPLLKALHNRFTERSLINLDLGSLMSRAELDSPAALAFGIEWAKTEDTQKLTVKSTAPYLAWYEKGEKSLASNGVSFMMGGDLMFDRKVAHDYAAGGLWKVFDQLGDRIFLGTDAGLANLEGAISEEKQPDDISPNNLTFVFNPETVDALTYAKFNGVSLANNHAANGGKKGLEVTPRLLKAANIQPIGGPGDDGIDKVGTFKGQGLTLHVIGVHTLASVPDLKPLIQKLKADTTARVIVFPHWGAEYIYKHGASQGQQAHAWIDAGADAVIGAHPHVIQDSELYKGKPIIYSLGNFVFDQYFSKETQRGLLLAGEFNDVGLRLFALPIQLKLAKPALLTGEEKKSLIDRLYEPFSAQKQTSEAGELLFFAK